MKYATIISGITVCAGLLVGPVLFLIGKFAIRFYSGHSKHGAIVVQRRRSDSDDMDLLFFHHFIFRRPFRRFLVVRAVSDASKIAWGRLKLINCRNLGHSFTKSAKPN
jgi:hypothetical protein